jgi:hypothetical protein
MPKELLLGQTGLLDNVRQRAALHLARVAKNHDWPWEAFPPEARVLAVVVDYP